MSVSITGISHHSAALGLRERVAFVREEIPEALRNLRAIPEVREAVLLSTCNRTEVISNIENDNHQILHWLQEYRQVSLQTLHRHSYHYTENQAVQHLLHVACGMDSMIFGEAQIFGQVKEAFAIAHTCGSVGNKLQALAEQIFHITRQVRRESGIGKNPGSLSAAVLTLAHRLFSELTDRRILLIGAGEIIHSIARQLLTQDTSQIVILNRSPERAQKLAAQIHAAVGPLEDIPQQLAQSDLLVSCTDSPHTIIEAATLAGALARRQHRPLLAIDLAVPRDIAPESANLSDLYLYDVDDLRTLLTQDEKYRHTASCQAEKLIEQGMREYQNSLRERDADQLISRWRTQIKSIQKREVERAHRRLQCGENPEQIVEDLAYALANKLMHAPTVGLRRAGAVGNKRLLNEAWDLLGIAAQTKTSETDES